MRKIQFMLLTVLALSALATAPASAAYPDGSAVMPYGLTDSTKLLVLSGRLGSRELFALRPGAGTATIAALGFDMRGREPGDRKHSAEYAVRASLDGLSLYPPSAGLVRRDLRLGFTFACISGAIPDGRPGAGLVLEHCVVSPQDFPRTLAETDALKTAIAPFFYHLLTVKNPSAAAVSARVDFGLSPSGAARRLGPLTVVPLPEPKGNRYSKKSPDQVLAAEALTVTDGIFHFQLAVPAGRQASAVVVQAAYEDEPVMESKRGRRRLPFYYTRFWKNIDELIGFAFEGKDDNLARTAAVEARLTTNLTPERRWLQALTFRTWLCNTWLLDNDRGEPHFYVWEGDFGMLSTVDVAHEVELMSYFMPWMLRQQLEEWVDDVGATSYGRRIWHDRGHDQQFGYSWYEKPQLPGGLPPMPVEENCNYALLLFWYDHLSGDRTFVRRQLYIMEDILLETMKRDQNGNGIADRDTGTTYDMSDAIHTAPDNVYLGVKQMSAYLCGAELLSRYDMPENLDKLRGEAGKILATLQKAHAEFGRLPVSLNRSARGWDQYSIALGDGLLYPSLTGFRTAELDGVIALLKADFPEALNRCRKPHAVLLSDGEPGTFFSKVMVIEPVAEYAYGLPTELWREPMLWNLNNSHAYNDGVKSEREDWEGYLYPRGVISLWTLVPAPPAAGGR